MREEPLRHQLQLVGTDAVELMCSLGCLRLGHGQLFDTACAIVPGTTRSLSFFVLILLSILLVLCLSSGRKGTVCSRQFSVGNEASLRAGYDDKYDALLGVLGVFTRCASVKKNPARNGSGQYSQYNFEC